MVGLGKLFVVIGIAVVAIGALLWIGGSIPGLNRLGQLPGDIYVKRGNFTFYFPLTTSIALSVIVTLILLLLRR